MKWLEVLKLVAPVVLSVVPGVPAVVIPIVVKAMEAAEAGGGSGEAKKKQVLTDLWRSPIPKGTDPLALERAVSQAVDVTVRTVNSCAR